MDLAQSATLFLSGDALAPAAFILSCIFSHTRGTPRKRVGRASFSVFTKEPWEINGTVKNIQSLIPCLELYWKKSLPSEHLALQSRWFLQNSCRPKCRPSGLPRGWAEGNWQGPPHRSLHLSWRKLCGRSMSSNVGEGGEILEFSCAIQHPNSLYKRHDKKTAGKKTRSGWGVALHNNLFSRLIKALSSVASECSLVVSSLQKTQEASCYPHCRGSAWLL